MSASMSRGVVDQRGFDGEFTRFTQPNVETLSGNKTITSADARVQLLASGASARNVTLDASLHVAGTQVYVQKTDAAAGSLVVKNSAAATLVTLSTQYGYTRLIYNGSGWTQLDSSFTAYSANLSGFTAGSVLFVNSSGQLAQDNAKLFWNNTGKFFGVGGAPSSLFHVTAQGETNALLVDDATGQTMIGTNTPVTGSSLILGSATTAMLVNRWTTTQRDTITPTNGMIGYNTDVDKFQGYAASVWVDLN